MKILTKELIRESEESAVLNGAFTFRQLMYKAGITAGEIINKFKKYEPLLDSFEEEKQ